MKGKKLLTFTFLFSLMTIARGQNALTQDPLQNFKHFLQSGVSINATRINTNHFVFETKAGKYQFDKGKYLPAFEIVSNFGWIWRDKDDNSIWLAKTGINLLTRSADLTDSLETNLRFTEGYIQIPIEIGFRSPLKFNTVKNNLYRATEFYIGTYVATPYFEKLDDKKNIDANGKFNFGNTLRFGLLAEIALSALNEKGHGHRFGLRFSSDFPTIVKIKDAKYQLYPYYNTVGIFYNFSNKYK
ncbi:MAG: hypothetical protein K2X37_08635 [Chitinophagaceae bacterium]|nr:hypothetical protein [Chitinophagaceae bacterium]